MGYQLPMGFVVPQTTWTLPSLDDLPQDWNDFPRIGLDTETRDEQLLTLGIGVRRGAYVVGISLAFEDGPTVYLPIRHAEGENLDANQVIAYLRRCALNYRGIIVGANLSYDLDFLTEMGIVFPVVSWFRDVLIAAPIINELELSYSLDAVGKRFINYGKDEDLLLKAAQAYNPKIKTSKAAKAILWRLPGNLVGPYAEQDAALPLQILRRQEQIIDENDLGRIWDLESKVLPCLVAVRRRGIRIDEQQLDAVARWSSAQQREALDFVHKISGVRIDPQDTMKASEYAKALRACGVPVPETGSGEDSVTATLLDNLDHVIGIPLRHARQMDKIRSTYVDAIRRYMVGGRIHCTFNQLRLTNDEGDDDKGTITARLSSSDPNLQNQPARDDEIAPMWRSIYLPEEGALLAAPDYSQQEPRWLIEWACLAGEKRIGYAAHQAALKAARQFSEDPKADFHDINCRNARAALSLLPFDEMVKTEKKKFRTGMKEINLGILYGMGEVKMCRKLKVPTVMEERNWGGKRVVIECAGPEGRQFINAYDAGVPFARAMANKDREQAKQEGIIRDIWGRHFHFPQKPDGTFDYCHKALNKRIQGTSATQTKAAMVALHEAGHFVQLQVHDEIPGSVADMAEARRMGEIMENVIPMRYCKMRVDVDVGPNWGAVA